MKIQRYLYIALIFLVCILTISAVSAADDSASDIISANDNEGLILDETISDDLSTSTIENDNELDLEDSNVDELDDTSNEKPALSEGGTGSFTDLNKFINVDNSGNTTITLNGNYKYAAGDDDFRYGVVISRGLIIDGKGCTIDGSSGARMFLVNTTNEITFKNINFINGNATSDSSKGCFGGAISSDQLENSKLTVINCNFTNNYAQMSGGALYGEKANSTAINCIFIQNSAWHGGAAYSSYAINCTFDQNTADEGGALYYCNETFCTFKNETDTTYETNSIPAVFNLSDYKTPYNSGKKLLFYLKADDVYLDGVNTTIHIRYESEDLIEIFDGLTGGAYGWPINLKAGKYQVILLLESHPEVEHAVALLEVYPAEAEIKPAIDTIYLAPGDSSKVEYTLNPSGADGEITFTSSNPDVVTVDSTGAIHAISEGNATITINLTKSQNYLPCYATVDIIVNKKTALTATEVTTTYNVNKDLVITLKDIKGNALSGLQLTVNLGSNKKYTTDENGQVKIATGSLVPKTYTAKISFAGNKEYNASSTTAKVTVKKAAPKMIANAKTFKFEDKTKKYTITLKNNKGKVMKNTKVSLKVNGKTYTATTNSKGVATIKLTKLTKKGTYNAVITYAGDKYYQKATKKAKITVKAPAWKTVAKGSKDKATVKKIQKALKDNGYYLTYKGRYLKIDGIYHIYTERAVKQFQKAKGLKVTGKVDYNTAKKLKIVS